MKEGSPIPPAVARALGVKPAENMHVGGKPDVPYREPAAKAAAPAPAKTRAAP